MNTLSLVLNGQTAAYISSLPEKQSATSTTLPSRKQRPSRPAPLQRSSTTFDSSNSTSPFPSLPRALSEMSIPTLAILNFTSHYSSYASPPSPILSGRSTPTRSRPSSSRRSSSSKYSPGWYTPNKNNFTLEDFARKLNTRSKRFEVWCGRCAQNVVMALVGPTPIVLFLFNPVSLMLWLMLVVWWVWGGA